MAKYRVTCECGHLLRWNGKLTNRPDCPNCRKNVARHDLAEMDESDRDYRRHALRRVGHGLYMDDVRHYLHIEPGEILDHMGLPHTEANIEMAKREAVKAGRKVYGNVPAYETDD